MTKDERNFNKWNALIKQGMARIDKSPDIVREYRDTTYKELKLACKDEIMNFPILQKWVMGKSCGISTYDLKVELGIVRLQKFIKKGDKK